MLTLDSTMDDEILQTRTSRTATFTLSSSSSSSSLCSQTNTITPRPSFDGSLLQDRLLKHSQSLTFECQRRRPIIGDPYQVTPNLQILDDWMICSSPSSVLVLLSYTRKQRYDILPSPSLIDYALNTAVLIDTFPLPSKHKHMSTRTTTTSSNNSNTGMIISSSTHHYKCAIACRRTSMKSRVPTTETYLLITTTGKSRQELSQRHGFSEEQIAVFEESFSLLDKDGDGNISNDEIRSLMNSLGYSPSEADIASVIAKVDIDGDGRVDFDEFLTMMQRRKSTGEYDTELLQVFNVFDKNKDGFIDKAELYDMLSRLGEVVTEEDVTEMIEAADCLDNDGRVSYEEFKAILYSK